MPLKQKYIADHEGVKAASTNHYYLRVDSGKRKLIFHEKLIVDDNSVISESRPLTDLQIEETFLRVVDPAEVGTKRRLYFSKGNYSFPVGALGNAILYTEVQVDNVILQMDLRSLDQTFSGPFFYDTVLGRLYYASSNLIYHTSDGISSTLVATDKGVTWTGLDLGGGSLWAMSPSEFWEFPIGSFPITGSQRSTFSTGEGIPRYDSSVSSVFYVRSAFLQGVWQYSTITETASGPVRVDELVHGVFPNPQKSRIIFSENPGGGGVIRSMPYDGLSHAIINDPATGVDDPTAICYDNNTGTMYNLRGTSLERYDDFDTTINIVSIPTLSGLHWGTPDA